MRVNSVTAGLAEACDAAVVRRPLDDRRFDSAIVGLERRLCAVAADDPLAGRRSVRLADLGRRVLLIDRRTGTTTTELFPPDSRPVTRETHDVDEWLTEISTGRCVGMTAESTAHQYPRPGVVYRPVRDAEPIAVRLAWWRDAPHQPPRRHRTPDGALSPSRVVDAGAGNAIARWVWPRSARCRIRRAAFAANPARQSPAAPGSWSARWSGADRR